MNPTRRNLVALIGGFALAGGLPSTAGAGPQAGSTTADGVHVFQVEIRNFAFSPAKVTVPAGARIVWINHDDEPHQVVSLGDGFKPSPALDTDESFTAEFSRQGTYRYFCSIHPMMVGMIEVR